MIKGVDNIVREITIQYEEKKAENIKPEWVILDRRTLNQLQSELIEYRCAEVEQGISKLFGLQIAVSDSEDKLQVIKVV